MGNRFLSAARNGIARITSPMFQSSITRMRSILSSSPLDARRAGTNIPAHARRSLGVSTLVQAIHTYCASPSVSAVIARLDDAFAIQKATANAPASTIPDAQRLLVREVSSGLAGARPIDRQLAQL